MQTINDYNLQEQYDRTAWTAERKSALVTRVYTKLTLSVLALALIEALVFALVGAEAVVAFTAQNVKLAGGLLLLLCIVGPMVGNAILARNPTRGFPASRASTWITCVIPERPSRRPAAHVRCPNSSGRPPPGSTRRRRASSSPRP